MSRLDGKTGKHKRGLRRGVIASGVFLGILTVVSSGAFAQAGGTAPREVYALTTSDDLLVFNGNNPNRTERVVIRGLRGNESLVGIDFRPSSEVPERQNALYGVGNKSNIYTINPENGRATRVSVINGDDDARVALEGSSFGVDFNPTVDRLRIISDRDQNLRVNVDSGDLADFDPNTAGTQPDGDLEYAAGDRNAGRDPWATAAAYRNSQPGAFNPPGTTANTTELYDIDTGRDSLVTQDPPNDGTLNTDGRLGTNVKLNTGFDIVTTGASPAGDQAYAALQMKSVKASGFFRIDLDTGDATSMGRINGGRTQVEGLAIPVGGTPVR